ncbi:DUF2339 domain-containing protein [Gordonia sp. NB41Y]|uniref:DUF2339 domain-containing protein n=1 Tax=Gordonia sp. NB41Y TaxID=875808 RepID=UPI00273B0D95|nr:DUF2339 domain-containing protein [Gordonia sp. NB41Y]WLP92454.1 DUF2339 domain-containing protein [Gordonia sp. NB41Y]
MTTASPGTPSPDPATPHPAGPRPLVPPRVTAPMPPMPPMAPPYPPPGPRPPVPPITHIPPVTPFGPQMAPFGPQMAPYPGPGQHPGVPLPPRQPSIPLRDRIAAAAERGIIGKVLAFVGVAITLIGVILLLVAAAQAGWLRPELRVAGGAVLAAVLFGAGVVIGRTPEKRTGALGLVATGTATAWFTILAATSLYHWIPGTAGLIAAGAVAAAGLGIARWWDSQPLGVTLAVALLILAPFLTGGVDLTLVVFLLVYATASLGVQLGRDWTAMYILNTVAAVIPPALLLVAPGDTTVVQFVLVASAAFLLTLGSAVCLLRTTSHPMLLALIAPVGVLPIIGATDLLGHPIAAIMLASAGILLVVLAFTAQLITTAPLQIRTVWLSAGAASGAIAIGLAAGAQGATLGLFGVALAMGLSVRYAGELATALRVIATVLGSFGLLVMLGQGALDQVLTADAVAEPLRITLAVGAALAVAAVTVLAYCWMRVSDKNTQGSIVMLAGLISLGLLTILCVSLGAWISDGTDGGFRAGHMAATIVWASTAVIALLWARRLHGTPKTLAMTGGLGVIGAAVAKLFLFDLTALDGLFRAIAFIVVGLLLLSLGVAYAQSLTGRSDDTDRLTPNGPPTMPMHIG